MVSHVMATLHGDSQEDEYVLASQLFSIFHLNSTFRTASIACLTKKRTSVTSGEKKKLPYIPNLVINSCCHIYNMVLFYCQVIP